MGLFDFGNKKVIRALQGQINTLQSYNVFQTTANINQNIAVYPAWDITEQMERYTSTDDIYSIIRKLSTTAALIPLYGYLQTADQKSFSKLVREQKGYKNPIKHKSLQLKALEDLPDSDPVAELLENPSESLSKYEFFEAIYSFLFLFGECFILKERPDFGINAGMPVKLHFLFPQFVVVKISETFPRRIVALDYRANGALIKENIPMEDVIHIKYFNPDMNYLGTELRGLSPLQVLRRRLTRLDSNMDVSVSQLQHGGVPGIVFDKSPNDEVAVEINGRRKDNFYRYLSSSNAGAPYFSSGDMGYIQTGMNLANLSVAELANIDFKKVCNAFGVSDILFNSDSASTESNVMLMTKSLYTNTVLPNVYRVRDALVRGLLPDFADGVILPPDLPGDAPIKIKGDGKKRYIDADISDITELHEDLARRSMWMANASWLTMNEKREMMNYERYDDPLFDQPWIPTGTVPLQELENVPPLPQATPNGL